MRFNSVIRIVIVRMRFVRGVNASGQNSRAVAKVFSPPAGFRYTAPESQR
jgi:hypothetical protein